MTDNEIIKALEICANNGDCKDCRINPHKGNYGYCTSLAIKAALNLINRQKAEIEELTTICDMQDKIMLEQKSEIERLTVELAAMRSAANSYKMHYDHAREICRGEPIDNEYTEEQT